MANLENPLRRIIGVRTLSAGPLLFCEAGDFSPAAGDWVLVAQDSKVFPAWVVLPDHLIETHRLEGPLPQVLGQAGPVELLAAGEGRAIAAEVACRFNELSAARQWPYLLKEVEARADRLIVRFSAAEEPGEPDYVLLLEELAGVYPGKIELFRVNEAAAPVKAPQDEKFAGWVNGLLKELDPAVLANATVGEPLLDESEVYRPGQRRPSETRSSEAEKPEASYDPVLKTPGPDEIEQNISDRGTN